MGNGSSGPSGPSGSPPSGNAPTEDQELWANALALINTYDGATPLEQDKIREKFKDLLPRVEESIKNDSDPVASGLVKEQINRVKYKLGLSGGRRRNRTRGRKHRRNRRSSKNRQ